MTCTLPLHEDLEVLGNALSKSELLVALETVTTSVLSTSCKYVFIL